jgi:hypothetical protein
MEEKPVEIKQVSEREIWVGESRFYLGEDDIFFETIIGKQDEKTVLAALEYHNKFKNMVEGKMKMLIDINKAGQVSSGARKIAKQTFEDEKIGKVAFCGLHPVARVIASFVMGVTRKKDICFFKTREEALAWLKGESS